MYHTWLRSFHAVARIGTVTAASKILNVSQSTISEQIKALEQRFAVELFHREGRTVRLSGIGKSLYEITRSIFGYEEEALRFLSAVQTAQEGQFSVAAVSPYIVMPPVQRFRDQFPKVQLSVSVGRPDDVIAGLENFAIDVAFTGQDMTDNRFVSVPYRAFPILIMVRRDHPWADRQEISITELAHEKMVAREPDSTTRRALEKAAQGTGTAIHNVIEVNSREAIREAVLIGLGIGAVSELEYVPHEELRSLRIADASLSIQFWLTCLASRQTRPLVRAFVDAAHQAARSPASCLQ